jgi:SAM-dependent methyltransferase
MSQDPFASFKAAQREGWSSFAPLEVVTTQPAAALVNFAGVAAGNKLLDVATGTGVVAITAARRGAQVSGLDLSPVLLERARANAALLDLKIAFQEGDAEALPYPDASFDVALSQFGHMFAPRPEVTLAEMLRVLKPGGRIAFSTWPPEHLVGRLFALTAKYLAPPEGVAPPPAWGVPEVVRQRLGSAARDLDFDRGVMQFPILSPKHYVANMETNVGPVIKLVAQLKESEPQRLATFRRELEALSSESFRDNAMHQHFLMSRAIKV